MNFSFSAHCALSTVARNDTGRILLISLYSFSLMFAFMYMTGSRMFLSRSFGH